MNTRLAGARNRLRRAFRQRRLALLTDSLEVVGSGTQRGRAVSATTSPADARTPASPASQRWAWSALPHPPSIAVNGNPRFLELFSGAGGTDAVAPGPYRKWQGSGLPDREGLPALLLSDPEVLVAVLDDRPERPLGGRLERLSQRAPVECRMQLRAARWSAAFTFR